MNKHLHIVTHDVPWPADYGGVIILFYKIKSLHQQGIKIHLHCFYKDRQEQSILNKYCESVTYYPRKKLFSFPLLTIPFIVQSRRNPLLLRNLLKDNYPILFEGIHCTYHLLNKKLRNRKMQVCLQNVEYTYYKHLARYEKNFFKKTYYIIESFLLYHYEKKLSKSASFWTVSELDTLVYKEILKANHVEFFPVFLPWTTVKSELGNGTYCLYQGNLEVSENDKAARWLLEEVFAKLKIPFVIAGRNPSPLLKKMAHQNPHTCMVENPSEHEMDDLIRKAQINIIPSFNNTGIKLKLLNALFNGRYCIVNAEAARGSGLENLCIYADTANAFIEKIHDNFYLEFKELEKEKRKEVLMNLYQNSKNATRIIESLY